MFDDRMDEELEWVQLDLDEISHDVSGNGLIVPICHQVGAWEIDKLLDKYVDVHQKVYEFTPNQKIMEVMASMMFGCEDNKRINKVLREDNPEYILKCTPLSRQKNSDLKVEASALSRIPPFHIHEPRYTCCGVR